MTSLPPGQWPTVLCGPMLRRVTDRSVCVFVALKEASTVTLTVYEGDEADPTKQVVQTHATDTVPLGERLHALALEAEIPSGQSPLQPGTTYGYDVTTTASGQSGAQPQDLGAHGLLGGDHPLGYDAGKLPTFSVPPSLDQLRLVHASCRKPHGGGFDALYLLDRTIRRLRNRPSDRPHQLLLTGDQIYADDVALTLLTTITATAQDLLSWNDGEVFSTPDGDVAPDSPQVWPGPTRRGAFVRDDLRLTTGYGDGHLLFLGEYYAMYLLAWSDALWPRDDRGDRTLSTIGEALARPITGAVEHPGPDADPDLVAGHEALTQSMGKDRRAVRRFAANVANIRRALANVPTYMMFDDHEVTDDWYLNGAWSDDVRGHAPGRQLLRNGLVAYAVFQDWGNQPENYRSSTLGETLLNRVKGDAGTTPAVVSDREKLSELLDIRDPGSGSTPTAQRMKWHYAAEFGHHQVIALDTRTRRDYGDGPTAAAALVSKTSLASQLDAHIPSEGTISVILSPAPVVGNHLVEDLQKYQVRQGQGSYHVTAEFDFEAWSANRAAFEDLLHRLSKFGSTVVVSGDVHYAFSNHIAYFDERTDTTQEARIVQLCSSPLKNQDAKTSLSEVMGHGGISNGWIGLSSDQDLTDAAPNLKEAMFPEGAPARVEAHMPGLPFVGVEYPFRFVVKERLEPPAVLPASGWQTDEALAIVQSLAAGGAGVLWRYTTSFVGDARSGKARIDAASGLRQALTAAGHEKADEYHGSLAREVVGTNNIGEVTFTLSEGEPEKVVHELSWYIQPTSSNLFRMVTRHELPLTMPQVSEKPSFSK